MKKLRVLVIESLYIVPRGSATFHLIQGTNAPQPLQAQTFDFVFVPVGGLHTFANTDDKDFEVIAFFSKANALPEVSLSVATGCFPKVVSKAGMTQYGDVEQGGDPLSELWFRKRNPYLVRVER